jgi:DTW domain-containing protein YfiP
VLERHLEPLRLRGGGARRCRRCDAELRARVALADLEEPLSAGRSRVVLDGDEETLFVDEAEAEIGRASCRERVS